MEHTPGNLAELRGYVMYCAYCDHTNWKSLATGDPLPQWDHLRDSIREAWIAVGRKTLEHAAFKVK